MKRLEVNSHNERYYTKDFISGFRCGTKRQLQSDLIVIDKIREEIADLDDANYDYEGYYKAVTDAVKIIDKYRKESEEL